MTYSTEMQIIISLEMFKGRKENQMSQIHLIFAHLNECVGQSSFLFFSYSRQSLFTLLTFVQLEWIECSLVLKHLSVWDLEPCFLGVPFREGRGIYRILSVAFLVVVAEVSLAFWLFCFSSAWSEQWWEQGVFYFWYKFYCTEYIPFALEVSRMQ